MAEDKIITRIFNDPREKFGRLNPLLKNTKGKVNMYTDTHPVYNIHPPA